MPAHAWRPGATGAATRRPRRPFSAILKTALSPGEGDAIIPGSPTGNAARIEPSPDGRRLICAGHWTVDTVAALQNRPPAGAAAGRGAIEAVDLAAVTRLDTAGAVLLNRLLANLGDSVAITGIRPEHAELIALVRADRPHEPPSAARQAGPLEQLGRTVVGHGSRSLDLFAFVGELTADSLPRLLRPHRLRGRQISAEIQRAGVRALPITGLLAFLMGVVIAYQSGTALAVYGANILLVDLLGITMLREMAPLLTAIIVAGRTGSAYAAQIGTMRITEEVDALRTLGITPFEMLALPKLIALLIALPLLTVWADVLGVLGGMVVASAFYSVSFDIFLERLPEAVGSTIFWTGVIKAPVFAAAITVVGCYQGFRVRGSAQAVGRATTVSVVQSIFLVIFIDAAFSIAYQRLGL